MSTSGHRKRVKMGKIIVKFWFVNVLVSILLFILYRLVIAEKNTVDTGFLNTIIVIMDISVNLVFSAVYLFAIALCSLLFFLNRIEKVRNSKTLCFLVFSGIPAVCLVILIIYILVGVYKFNMAIEPLKTLLLFTFIYLGCTILEFIAFRNVIEKEE